MRAPIVCAQLKIPCAQAAAIRAQAEITCTQTTEPACKPQITLAQVIFARASGRDLRTSARCLRLNEILARKGTATCAPVGRTSVRQPCLLKLRCRTKSDLQGNTLALLVGQEASAFDELGCNRARKKMHPCFGDGRSVARPICAYVLEDNRLRHRLFPEPFSDNCVPVALQAVMVRPAQSTSSMKVRWFPFRPGTSSCFPDFCFGPVVGKVFTFAVAPEVLEKLTILDERRNEK